MFAGKTFGMKTKEELSTSAYRFLYWKPKDKAIPLSLIKFMKREKIPNVATLLERYSYFDLRARKALGRYNHQHFIKKLIALEILDRLEISWQAGKEN